jgi:hypothetical protein
MKHRLSFIMAKHAADVANKKIKSEDLNYSELSRKTGCTVSSLWFYFNERRRWPADSWLKTMHELGALDIKQNTITIRFPGNQFREMLSK